MCSKPHGQLVVGREPVVSRLSPPDEREGGVARLVLPVRGQLHEAEGEVVLRGPPRVLRPPGAPGADQGGEGAGVPVHVVPLQGVAFAWIILECNKGAELDNMDQTLVPDDPLNGHLG